jgi:hypothetical protein
MLNSFFQTVDFEMLRFNGTWCTSPSVLLVLLLEIYTSARSLIAN